MLQQGGAAKLSVATGHQRTPRLRTAFILENQRMPGVTWLLASLSARSLRYSIRDLDGGSSSFSYIGPRAQYHHELLPESFRAASTSRLTHDVTDSPGRYELLTVAGADINARTATRWGMPARRCQGHRWGPG